jgi:hypothetical protein
MQLGTNRGENKKIEVVDFLNFVNDKKGGGERGYAVGQNVSLPAHLNLTWRRPSCTRLNESLLGAMGLV